MLRGSYSFIILSITFRALPYNRVQAKLLFYALPPVARNLNPKNAGSLDNGLV
jgi:hypothetical protein